MLQTWLIVVLKQSIAKLAIVAIGWQVGFSQGDLTLFGQSNSDSWEQIAADAIAAADVSVEQKSALILRAIRMAQQSNAPLGRQNLGGPLGLPNAADQLPLPAAIKRSQNGYIFEAPRNADRSAITQNVPRHARLTPALLPHFQFSDESRTTESTSSEMTHVMSTNTAPPPNLATQWSNVLEPRPSYKMLEPKLFEFSLPTINRERAARTGPMDLRR